MLQKVKNLCGFIFFYNIFKKNKNKLSRGVPR